MTDDTIRREPRDRPEQTAPKQSGNDVSQQEPGASAEPGRGGQPLAPAGQPPAPGRMPLFRR